MRKRPFPSLARLIAAVETVLRRPVPQAPVGARPAGGPVVFRHYL